MFNIINKLNLNEEQNKNAMPDGLQLLNNTSQTTVNTAIHRKHLLNFGYVKEVIDENIVKVDFKLNRGKKQTIDCYYLNYTSQFMEFDFTPAENDPVLLLSLNLFAPDMFFDPESVENFGVSGYNMFSYIALPVGLSLNESNFVLNATQDGIVWTGKKPFTVKVLDPDDDDKEKAFIKLDVNGALNFNNEKASVDVLEDGNCNFKNEKVEFDAQNNGDFTLKNENVTITAKNNGELTIDNGTGKGKIEMASGGKVTINGNLEVS